MSVQLRNKTSLGTVHQRGMTVVAVILILISIAFVALIAMRIIPIYVSYFSVRSALEGLKKEPEVAQMGIFDIQQRIQKRFDISYVKVIDPKQVKIRQQGRDKILELVYEDRRPLIANLDVVAKFNDTIVLSSSP
jgi:hypothetical protein